MTPRGFALFNLGFRPFYLLAALRVLAALAPQLGYVALLGLSGVSWAVAFLLYFATYLPRLVAPRVDGKPG